MKLIEDMTRTELEDVVRLLESRGVGAPLRLGNMTRADLAEYAVSLRRPPRQRLKAPFVPRQRMPKNLGVGKHVRRLLAKVIAQSPDGPVGYPYKRIVAMAQRKFPDSAVDERHVRWYAAQMRRDDLTIPVNRARSNWLP